MNIKDSHKHLIICAIASALASLGIALLLWVSLVVTSCEELTEHLLAPVWFAGVACALAMGVGKEYGDECAEGNEWSWDDIAADIVGAIIGSSLICFTIKLILIC